MSGAPPTGPTALIVGNGLTIDRLEYAGEPLSEWDPRHPLGWSVPTPGAPSVPFLDSLPRLQRAITAIHAEAETLDDFACFDAIVRSPETYEADEYGQAILRAEVCHFLAIAFSAFQLASDEHAVDDWRWTSYVREVAGDLVVAVSFNYDLILERALAAGGASFQRAGVSTEPGNILIVKPHGSIDFETSGIEAPVGYPLQNAILRNDTPLRALAPHELLEPRTEVDVIAPRESSWLADFQWVGPGYAQFAAIAPSLWRCLFIGLSCAPADRDEIDHLIDALSPGAKVIVADPSPPADFIDRVRAKFELVVEWHDGPTTE